jgi:hypothetical protein
VEVPDILALEFRKLLPYPEGAVSPSIFTGREHAGENLREFTPRKTHTGVLTAPRCPTGELRQ